MPVRSAFLFVVLVSACSRPPAPVRDPSQADLELNQVSVRSYSGGTLRVVTTADRLDVFREAGNPGDLVAHDAGVLLVRDGTRLTAPLVTGNFLTGQLVGQGGVTMVGQGGLQAKSPSVAFDRTQGAGGMASSDAGLWMSQPGLTLTADGFVMDLADEHATFVRAKTDFSAR